MHILTICYGMPDNTDDFDSYYENQHRKLAERIPGQTGMTVRRCESIEGGPAPYYQIVELSFPDSASLAAAMSSVEGQAAAADVENFASGGYAIFIQHDDM